MRRFRVSSDVAARGGDPAHDVVRIPTRPGEDLLRLEDILDTIERLGERLATVLRGIVSRQGRVMTPGTCWGEDFLLATDSLKDYRTCLSLTYVELLSIGRDDFFALLDQFPDSAEVVRKAIVRMTFYRGVLKVAKAPMCAEAAFPYCVGDAGLEGLDGPR